jgi:hypothetical protein
MGMTTSVMRELAGAERLASLGLEARCGCYEVYRVEQ